MEKFEQRKIQCYAKKISATLEKHKIKIKTLYSSLDEKQKTLFHFFAYLDKQVIRTFPFHEQGIIDETEFVRAEQVAKVLFLDEVNNISEGHFYVTFIVDNCFFLAEMRIQEIKKLFNMPLEGIKIHDSIFTEEGFALEIYMAEYEWKVLLAQPNQN